MINIENEGNKAKGFQRQIDDYYTLGLLKSNRGIAAILMGVFFFVAIWSNIFLAAILLPLIWFTYQGKRWAMITGSLYSVPLTIILIAAYIEMGRNQAGDFVSSLTPVYLYLVLCGVILRYLYLASKVEKQRKLQKIA